MLVVISFRRKGVKRSRSEAVETVQSFWWLLAILTPERRMSVCPVGYDGNTTLKAWLTVYPQCALLFSRHQPDIQKIEVLCL